MTRPASLFKYMPITEYTLENLLNRQLYLSCPNSFNDPFDSSLLHYCQDYSGMVYPEKQNLQRLVDLTQSQNVRQMGCTCLCESNDNVLMWSHYAQSHKGICLEFDASVEPFSLAEKVQYQDTLPEECKAKAGEYNFEECKKLALIKSPSWEYEQEWRIIQETDDDQNRTIPYPREALKAIYFGMNIGITHKRLVCLIMKGIYGTDDNVDYKKTCNVVYYDGISSKDRIFKLDFKQAYYRTCFENEVINQKADLAAAWQKEKMHEDIACRKKLKQ